MKRLVNMIAALTIGYSLSVAQDLQNIETHLITQSNQGNFQKESPFSLSLELASRYIWRGLEYGDAPVSFATLGYGYKDFCVWAMGAYAFNGSHQEVDVGVTYAYDWLTVGVSDYYYPSEVGTSDKYFNYNNHTTGHSGEAYATIASSKLPMWLTISCYLYGADKNPDGKQAYSSYAETGYTYSFKDENAISLAIGASLNKGFYTNYQHGFSVVNIALKYSTAFRFGSFKLPVSGTYVINPQMEKSYLTFSAYFSI